MSFDNSRITFNSWNDYLGVVMQQGRVQLDSDWNEFQAELLRRLQAGTLDLIGQGSANGAGGSIAAYSTAGRAVYPASMPNSFQIRILNRFGRHYILIGAGRVYVDGILVENHGPSDTAQWDPILAELSNSYPGAGFEGIGYTNQPYYPGVASPAGGTYLAYLDVWQRPVTYIEDSQLVDAAVGVDTTGRLQTVWQVKLFPVPAGTDCTTPDAAIPGWLGAIAGSSGRLSSNVVSTTPSGPCCITPNTGYTGLENQLYRVEVHQDSASGSPTFKWSRDDASVMTAVTAIATVSNTAGANVCQLTVDSLGRDQVLGFNPGDWVEIVDDWLELNGQAGELHLIDSVTASSKTIVLDSPLASSGSFPVDSNGLTIAERHTRIRKWNQAGTVYDVNQNAVVTLGAGSNGGDIPITPGGPAIVLENGVTVAFDLVGSGGFKVGDYWCFAARAADGKVEILQQAPPLGIHHHYARLATLTFPAGNSSLGPLESTRLANLTLPDGGSSVEPLDCRTPWPPQSEGCCGCTVTVDPAELAASGTTLQQVADQFKGLSTESVICLKPGTYLLDQPLRLTSAHSNLTIRACQDGQAILQANAGSESAFVDGMVVMDAVVCLTLSGIAFTVPIVSVNAATLPGGFGGIPFASLDGDVQALVGNLSVSIGLRPIGCSQLTIERCSFTSDFERYRQLDAMILQKGGGTKGATPFGVFILATGESATFQIEDNTFDGGPGTFAGFLLAPSVSLLTAAPAQAAPATAPAQASPMKVMTTPASGRKKAVAKARVIDRQPPPDYLTVTDPVGSKFGTDTGNYGTIGTILGEGTALAAVAANGGSVIASDADGIVFDGNDFADMTLAALLVIESNQVSFTNNSVEVCTAGLWIVAPTELLDLELDPQNVTLIGLTLAMGYPLPSNLSTAPASVPPAPAAVRVYAGPTPYLDSNQNTWLPDASATSVLSITGSSWTYPNPGSALVPISLALPGATDQPLYQYERAGPSTFTFTGLPTGFYTITLKLAEIYYGAANPTGTRYFGVSINGVPVIADLNIADDVGQPGVATDKVFRNVVPSAGGQIVVDFTAGTQGTDPTPKIDAISVLPQWDGSNPLSGVAGKEFASVFGGSVALRNFFVQLAEVGQQAFTDYVGTAFDLRITGNEMEHLKAPALLILGDDQAANAKASALVLSGNRMDASVSVSLPSNFLDTQASPAVYRIFATVAPFAYFYSVAAVTNTTKCLVTGNIIANNGKSHGPLGNIDEFTDRVSLNVDNTDAVTDMHGRVGLFPGIAISGNILQGALLCKPEFYEGNPLIPYPPLPWFRLNTITV